MLAHLLRRVSCTGRAALEALHHRLAAATKPATPTLIAGALTDLARNKPELVAENAFLRQQLVVLTRSVKHPRCTPGDRTLLVLLAGRVRAWRQALLIIQSDTLLVLPSDAVGNSRVVSAPSASLASASPTEGRAARG